MEELAPILLDYQSGRIGMELTLSKIEIILVPNKLATPASPDGSYYSGSPFAPSWNFMWNSVTYSQGTEILDPRAEFQSVHNALHTRLFIGEWNGQKTLVETERLVFAHPRAINIFDEIHAKDDCGVKHIFRVNDCKFYNVIAHP